MPHHDATGEKKKADVKLQSMQFKIANIFNVRAQMLNSESILADL